MGLQKNVASQKWRVFAFNTTTNAAVAGDAANITAKIAKDWAAATATNDVNPTEVEDGYYVFDLLQAETNADVLDLYPESSTSNVQVIGVPGTIFTVPDNFPDLGIETDGDLTKVNTLDGHTAQTGDSFARIGATGSGLTTLATQASVNTVDGVVDAIKLETDKLTLQDAGAGVTGSIIEEIENRATPAQVESSCDTSLQTINLDHLLSASGGASEVTDNSLWAKLHSDSASYAGYNQTTDSLEALAIRRQLVAIPSIPTSIDLANTQSVRLKLVIVNTVGRTGGNLPAAADLTAGTIDIHRKAIGGTSWTSVVSGAACTAADGMIYYDEVFDSGTGYAEGDSIRITFKGQVYVDPTTATSISFSDATGRYYQTEIRQTMRGTDGSNTTTPPTVAANRRS